MKEVITDETVIGTGLCHGDMCDEGEHEINPTDLRPKYRTLLLESEANAKKAKAWDELHYLITDVDKVPVPYEYFNGLNWVESKMSELMKEKP